MSSINLFFSENQGIQLSLTLSLMRIVYELHFQLSDVLVTFLQMVPYTIFKYHF